MVKSEKIKLSNLGKAEEEEDEEDRVSYYLYDDSKNDR